MITTRTNFQHMLIMCPMRIKCSILRVLVLISEVHHYLEPLNAPNICVYRKPCESWRRQYCDRLPGMMVFSTKYVITHNRQLLGYG